ncbi:Wall-associated receptor kinase-like 2 [Sesamum alatum]|uniref:Wall-associated receptor kinase-like 2 n=1 Tax=Sesamum alatum TaxID=300844 RepID=A0AAE1YLS1_9LAMI|nr:Wall-associated receptor kinase-like 2 [Sesamum alatum]
MLTNVILYSLIFHFVWLQSACAASDKTNTTRPPTTITKGAMITKPGCQSKCGNLTVPYPFGIGLGSGCSIDPAFDINCNTSYNPPKAFISLGNLEVIDISDSQMRVKNWLAATCYDQQGKIESRRTSQIVLVPYFSFSDVNKLFTVGCDDFSNISGVNFYTGCIASCTTKDIILEGYCNGIGCCQIPIPKGLRRFRNSVDSFSNHSSVWPFNPCGYSFLGDLNSFTFHSSDLTDPTFIVRTIDNVPIILDWVIGSQTCASLLKSNVSACHQNSS